MGTLFGVPLKGVLYFGVYVGVPLFRETSIYIGAPLDLRDLLANYKAN